MRWPLIRYIPKQTNFKFVRFARLAAFISVILVIGSLISLFTRGLNLGVDFKGGTILEASWSKPINLGAVRDKLGPEKLGDLQVQNFGSSTEALIRFQPPANADASTTVDRIKGELREIMPGVEFKRVEVVGPKVSGELFSAGISALAIAMGLVMLYVWFRFELQMGVGSIVALLHDIILTLGFLSITQIEFSLNSIAALLTIIGYSMNDTVVVFDRLRENLRKFKKMPLGDVIDLSTNETLSRTIITGLTTLLALIALTILGGDTLFAFTVAMIFGVVIGTYSSIYVAAPFILIWAPKNRGENVKAEVVDVRP